MPKGIRINLIVVLLLLWGVGNAFWFPAIAAAGFFCTVIVPTVNVVAGKKYGIPLAGLGVAWFVIAIINYWN